MSKLKISNVDAHLCGIWAMSEECGDRRGDLEKLIRGEDAMHNVWIVKLNKSGELTKKKTCLPFHSFHSNREIRRAYNKRNANPAIEILGEMESKTLDGVAVKCGDLISFELDGRQYHAKAKNYTINSQIWLDDEGKTYNDLRAGKLTESDKKELFINSQYYQMYVVDVAENKIITFGADEYKSRAVDDVPKFEKICAIIEAENAKKRERIAKYFDRYRDKIRFSGYWVNQ
jgi:hypothetical protein